MKKTRWEKRRRCQSIVGTPLLLLLLSLAQGMADVTLPDLFSDHAVLQRAQDVAVWGSAAPGEEIVVALGGLSERCVADADGKWRVALDLENVETGPHDLIVKGNNTLTIEDVLVGEVWLCSGQSNMAFELRRSDQADQEIRISTNTLLRQFLGERRATPEPSEELRGKWIVADPQSAGEFSAVAYYFGKSLQKERGTPVGLINCSWGGTPIEAWTSAGALDGNATLKERKDREVRTVAEFETTKTRFSEAMERWLKNVRREDPGAPDIDPFAGLHVAEAEWCPVRWAGSISGRGLPARGVIWLRKEFEIPRHAPASGEPLILDLQDIRGFDTVYLNGHKVAETPYPRWDGEGSRRLYHVPPERLIPGRNVVAIRIFAPSFAPALAGYSDRLKLGPWSLDGTWLARGEYELPVTSDIAPPPPIKALPEPEYRSAYLYNGMIRPIISYGIKGVLWYQGEANAGRAYLYRSAFPLLINDWRASWGKEDLPFYFCQLANFRQKDSLPNESSWAELREAQGLALRLPHTGQTVLIDIGEAGDVHPRNKKEVGERLARLALSKTYGVSIPATGPEFESVSIDGEKVRLTFQSTEGGLIARKLPETFDVKTQNKEVAPLQRNSPDSELEGFAICGSDKKWVWAMARIEGDCVVVWSPQVSSPIAVRYGWADNPTCNHLQWRRAARFAVSDR